MAKEMWLHRTYECPCGERCVSHQPERIAYSYGDTFWCSRCKEMREHKIVEISRTEEDVYDLSALR